MTSPLKEPFKLKDIYSPALIRDYASLLKNIWPSFPEKKFYQNVFHSGWENEELKERMRHISRCLKKSLPVDYPEALNIVTKSAEILIEHHGMKMLFEYGFIPDFVEQFGVDHPDESLHALEIITQLSSAEFAIRPFLLKYPERMYSKMITWADHPHPFVRRLASEGFRPRLPWGMGISTLKKDPSPVLLVLEKLKSDPSETVRRSVANNLNDISKDHPELALKVLKKWKGLSPETDLLIKHAGRGLLKKGNENVMALFGFNPGITAIEISNVKHDKQVVIGEKFSFSFTISNLGRKATDTRVEYMIGYLSSSGKISKKVFQVRERNMSPGMSEFISKRQSFANLTTRKHYPGRHKLSIVLNGKAITSFTFLVKA